jgi:hypothetical protein
LERELALSAMSRRWAHQLACRRAVGHYSSLRRLCRATICRHSFEHQSNMWRFLK